MALAPPGPQRPSRWNHIRPISLRLLTLLAILLAVQAFVRANFPNALCSWGWFWTLTILDTNNAFTLLVAVLGFVTVRQQFAFGTRPLLTYTTQQNEESDRGLKLLLPDDGFWTVMLGNDGAGPAVIRSVDYELSATGDPDGDMPSSYQDVLSRLQRQGILVGRDYVLTNYGKGATIGPGRHVLIFEMSKSAADKIKRLDLIVRFQGRLGDSYVKMIHCIPRAGVPGIKVHLAV